MGREIETTARERGHEIAAIVDKDNREDMDKADFLGADVAIEFTTPESARANCRDAMLRGIPVVCGTTGWLDQQLSEAQSLCDETGGTLLWSPNFSIGVAVTRLLSNQLASLMNRLTGYVPTLKETHHQHKRDHPSGTAISLAEDLTARVDRLTGWQLGIVCLPDGQTLGSAETDADKLRIDCLRRGEVAGIHSVSWDSEDDRITLTHEAHSRRGFARGAVMAAEYAARHQGLLTMDNVLEDLFHTK